MLIEPECAALAAQQATPAQLAAIRAAHEGMSLTDMPGQHDRVSQRHRRRLRQRRPGRQRGAPVEPEPEQPRVQPDAGLLRQHQGVEVAHAEHQRILTAILARDPIRARHAMHAPDRHPGAPAGGLRRRRREHPPRSLTLRATADGLTPRQSLRNPSAPRRPLQECLHDGSTSCPAQWRPDTDAAVAHPRRAARVPGPGRKLSALHRRAARTRGRHRTRRVPPGKRRRLHGRGLRQAHRRAGHLLRHARSGRHQRQHRRAHGLPGFHAHDPVRGPGRQRLHGARGFPGNRLPPHVRPHGQVGRPDRPLRPHPRVHRPRLRHRHQRPARPVVLALPKTRCGARPPSRTCRATSACRTIPARRTSNACAPRWTPRAILPAGRRGWTARAVQRIAAFAQSFELPVGTWRRLESSTSAIPTPPARSAGA